MLLRLLLIFTLVPAIELFLLLQIGSMFGPTATFLFILLTGLLGATLAKREGLGVLRELQGELARGLPPGDRLVEGVLVLVGGLLLITPGVFTDVVGILLIMPPSRRFLAPRVLSMLKQRFSIDAVVTGQMGGQPWAGPPPQERAPHRVPRDRAGASPFSSPFDD